LAGWIKVHRRLKESAVFGDPDLLKLWLLCLLKATHKPREVVIEKQVVRLEPGQFVTGRFELEKEYNDGVPNRKKISASTLQRWLRKLETWQMLNIKTYSKFSIVTVSNWTEYQQDEQQVNNKWTTDEQQVDTDKNDKNGKNDKKYYGEFVRLTDEEHQKLTERLGQALTADYIERLNNYIGSKGTKYKSHYHTILTWVRNDEKKQAEPPTRKRQLYMPEGDE
jgi:transcription termination factor NusB